MKHTGDSIELLNQAKDRIVTGSGVSAGSGRPLLSKQWESLAGIAQDILEACHSQDLGSVASSTRRMKNKLRRPQFRMRLEALDRDSEDGDSEKKEKPSKDGDDAKSKCLCSKCNKDIELIGGRKCVEGALCSDCALDSKQSDDKRVGESVLRRRRY